MICVLKLVSCKFIYLLLNNFKWKENYIQRYNIKQQKGNKVKKWKQYFALLFQKSQNLQQLVFFLFNT